MSARIGRVLIIVPALALLASCAGQDTLPEVSPEYLAEIEQWRAERNERLRQQDSWLTLVGLYWLEPGENRFGSDPSLEIVFEEGGAAARGGSLFLEGEQVRVVAAAGSGLTLGGEPVGERVLAPDTSGQPDILELGDLRFHIIRREDKFGVRVKNPESELLRNFTGLDFYPVDGRYRIEGRFVPYEEPQELPIATVLGGSVPMKVPGRVELDVGGTTVSLEPVLSGQQYWFLFRDATSGKETYGAGRYLYADPAEDGKLVVDFNLAYNPPCVFTPYATCPLPPRQNWLEVPIEAGEKMYGAEAH